MSGAGLNSMFVASLELQDFFVSNQNGEPNAGGIVTFYKDNNRTQLKDVYELTQDPITGAYDYAALPNPLTLSGVGTFMDGAGNNVAVYYNPYDEFGNIELYYITVYDAFGNLQCTREAWPFPNAGTGGGGGGGGASSAIGNTNQLSNPQFAFVNFTQGGSLVIPISGAGTTNFAIAPDWNINIVSTGASTVTITQTPVAGQAAYPYNPPFTLDFVVGTNITSCQLIQTFRNNPDWAAQTLGNAGYLSASILIGNGTSVNIQYVASNGNPAQTILNTTNATGFYQQVSGTIQLLAAASGQTGITGYDNIVINLLNLPGNSSISNVQVIPLTSNVSGVQYDQTPVNRQLDHLFNYYNPLLQFKPNPSYLVGWNFPLNPAQLGSNIAAQAIGANRSYYGPAIVTAAAGGWDQTIFFQSTNSGLTISRDATGALKVLAAQAGQHALVQYLPAPVAIQMLSRRKCVMVSANASVATIATVSLWYTKGTLPSTIGANNSIVATLDANGYPATTNGTGENAWVQIPRSGLNNNTTTAGSTNAAQFTIPIAPSGASSFNHIPLSGWDMQGNTDINSATFFAIVIGTANLAQNAYILYQDISCQDGDIPTVTGAQTADEVYRQCQYYFSSSFNPGVIPATQTGVNYVVSALGIYFGGAAGNYASEYLTYPVNMYQVPIIVTYNPVNNNNFAYSEVTASDCSLQLEAYVSQTGFLFQTHQSGTTPGQCIYNWSADARLGQ